MRSTLTRLLVCATAAVLVACGSRPPGDTSVPASGDILLARDADVFESVVPRDATLERLLRQHDLSPQVAHSLIESVRLVFNPRQLRAQRPYKLVVSLDGLIREFRYEIDADRFLRVIGRQLAGEGDAPAFEAEVIEYPRSVAVDAVDAVITKDRPSLVAAMAERGENVYLALKLADAFSGLVDFNSELQDGDRIRVLVDRVYRNGQFSDYGDLRAAVLENDGRTFTAIPFELNGTVGWYDAEGRSLKRQFLKSPLRLQTSISSGFSYRRLHPVTGDVRAHPAIDYRAGYGAPVVAVAAGTVAFAAPSGASGRLIKVRHAGGYESMYLHLSAFKVRVGQKVSQGQVIGSVGNSGLVTATHLDFRMTRNGRYINPLTLFRNLPPGDPIPASRMAAFMVERDRLFREMDERLAVTRNANAPNNHN